MHTKSRSKESWKRKLAHILHSLAFRLSHEGGETDMTVIYVNMIHRGLYTLAQVPVGSQEQVRNLLTSMGLDENGNAI